MAQVEIIAANLKPEKNDSFAKNTKKRVAAYARVSSDSEEQLNSYSSQIKYYTEKIKANPDWEFVGIYADEGISGTQVKNRTEFQRMIDDALNGKIDIILAKSISRFARNTLDTLKYVRDLRDHKVDVYFEKENIHTLELDSEMFLTLYSAFAQAESESTSQNVKMGLRAMMKRGECVGRANPYGYNWDRETKTLSINEEEAEVVRMIFNWYVSGIGTRVIAKKLNEMKILSPGGKEWSQQYVRTMISQEKYVGDLLGQKNYTVSPLTHKKMRNYGEKAKYYVRDHHIPIISREVWDKAQEILKKRSNKIIPEGQEHYGRFSQRYAFSSKIKCGFCGTNYSRRVSGANKSGFKKVYWTCYKHVLESNDCPESHGIREEILKNTFIQLYNSVMKNKYKTKDLMLNAIKSVVTENDNKKKKETLLKEKETLEKRLSNLLDLKLDDYDNKDLYTAKEEEINSRLKAITEKIKSYDMLESEKKILSKQIKEIEKHFEKPEVLKEFDEEAFKNMIDSIIVGDYNEDGTPNPNIIRFILKVGGEYVLDLDYENESEISEEESVSFAQRKRFMFSRYICFNTTYRNFKY